MAHGADVVLFDVPSSNKSSHVAAGLWNPIVLKRMKKVWLADEMIAELEYVYPDMQNWTGEQFYHPLPLRHLFASNGERNQWEELVAHPGFSTYLQPASSAVPTPILGSFGSGLTARTGRVNVSRMINSVKAQLANKRAYREEQFQWQLLQQTPEGVVYARDLHAHRVISCEGIQSALSKHSLPLQGFSPAKGEILKLQLPQSLNGECVHSKHFILDEGNQTATVGATYAWDGFELGPTAAKRRELEQHVERTLSCPFEVVEQFEGVRPATQDRRPMVGPHPNLEHTYVFNGMGSRAVLMAPYLARQLSEHLLYGVPLLAELDPKRFEKSTKEASSR